MVKCHPMKITRGDRSLIAWMLYCSVLFNVFACSIGHGQMVGMQLNGIGGQFCTVDPRTQAPKPSTPADESLPTLSNGVWLPAVLDRRHGPGAELQPQRRGVAATPRTAAGYRTGG